MTYSEIQSLSNDLSAIQPVVLQKASSVLGREVNEASLHGILGGKNATHVNSGSTYFSCFEEFFACWLDAMYNDYLRRKGGKNPMEHAGYRNARLLRDIEIMNYTEKFLKRAFLRKNVNDQKKTTASQGNIQKFTAKISSLKQKFYSI